MYIPIPSDVPNKKRRDRFEHFSRTGTRLVE